MVVASLDGGRNAMATVEVSAGATQVEADLEFREGLNLTGQVLLGDEPLAGARVQLSAPERSAFSGSTTDHQGRFEILSLEEGTYQLSVLSFRDSVEYTDEVHVGTDEELLLRIPLGSLEGRVFDAQDQSPLAEAVVEVHRMGEDGPFSSGSGMALGASSGSGGEFRFDRLSAGSYEVRVQHDGYAQASLPIEIGEGSTAPPLEVALEPTAGLVVEAHLPSGASPRSLIAALVQGDVASLAVRSYSPREDGSFHLPSIPNGSWELLVSSAGEATVRVPVSVPGPPVRVQIPPSGDLVASLSDPTGTPGFLPLTVEDETGARYRDLSSGAVRDRWPMFASQTVLENLPVGRWVVQAEGADGTTWRAEAVVTAGSRTPVTLTPATDGEDP